MDMKNQKKKRQEPDLFQQEAARLAQLPARQRKEALDVHRRIAEDTRLSETTRAHARFVADTLEKLIAKIRKKKRDKGIDGR
jgi:hypothetical protein